MTTAQPLRRDAAWFADLFRDHHSAISKYFYRRADRVDVEDLAAEVFAVAWRRRNDLPDGFELAWLYRTAGLLLANHRRRSRLVPVADIADDIEPIDPSHLVLLSDQMRNAMASLSGRDQRILLLVAWEGVSGDELALTLGLSRGGADAALSRARARLLEAIKLEEASGE